MDLRELYQEVIIDHNRNPRNHHKMEAPTNQADGFNPLCGDKLTVYLQVEGDKVLDISFLGCGCAISQASASLMPIIASYGIQVRFVSGMFAHGMWFSCYPDTHHSPHVWQRWAFRLLNSL